jgi:hypothetical protein
MAAWLTKRLFIRGWKLFPCFLIITHPVAPDSVSFLSRPLA